MVLDATIEEIDMSVRLFNTLKRAGIMTVSDVISLTWQELIQKSRMTPALMKELITQLGTMGLRLSNLQNDEYRTTEDCIKYVHRQMRLSKSQSFRLEFLPPDPGNYTNGGKGYTIYFNIHSMMDEPVKLSIKDSSVFANKRQWVRDYNYTGYALSGDYVFPSIPRTVGQIFLTENASYDQLEKDDYYTLSFECVNNDTLYFYKYIYLGNGKWEFYDYYEMEKE